MKFSLLSVLSFLLFSLFLSYFSVFSPLPSFNSVYKLLKKEEYTPGELLLCVWAPDLFDRKNHNHVIRNIKKIRMLNFEVK